MKTVNLYYIVSLAIMFILLISISACSSLNYFIEVDPSHDKSQTENSRKILSSTQDIEEEERYRTHVDGPIYPDIRHVFLSQIVDMGKDVLAIDIIEGELILDALRYTVKTAKIFNSYTEAGITASAMLPFVDNELLNENGDLKPNVMFLLVELIVENVRAEPETSITNFLLIHADKLNETLDKSVEVDFYDLPYPCYFSDPTADENENDWSRYYFFYLPVNHRKNLSVGWYVDLDEWNQSNLYLVFNRDHETDVERFVSLGL